MTDKPNTLRDRIDEVIGMVATNGSTSGVATDMILSTIYSSLEEESQAWNLNPKDHCD